MHHGRTVVPPTAFTVRNEVQGTPFEAVVDTGAEVRVLDTEVYNQLQVKPPVQRQVTVAGWGWRPPERLHSWPL